MTERLSTHTDILKVKYDCQTANPRGPGCTPTSHSTGTFHFSQGMVLAVTAKHGLQRHLGTRGVFFFHRNDKQVAPPGNLNMGCPFPALVTVDGGGDERQEGGQFSFPTALLSHSAFQNLPPSHLM